MQEKSTVWGDSLIGWGARQLDKGVLISGLGNIPAHFLESILALQDEDIRRPSIVFLTKMKFPDQP